MAFYDTVQSPRDFSRKASAENAQNFQTLSDSTEWKSAASSWGLEHLLACRVLCAKPSSVLPDVRDTFEALKRQSSGWESVIQDLIRGPNEDKSTLGSMSEVKILRIYDNDGLGHLWAALSPLVKPKTVSTSDRQMRERNPSQSVEPQDSSPRESLQISTPSATESTPSSIGYYEAEWAPLLEDITVKFASCFIRHVLAFCQPADKVSVIAYRDARMAHRANTLRLCAINDGGLQVLDQQRMTYQVALLEAKRAFQTIQNGRPTISDGLLGQMVGEALGVIASGSSIFRNRVMIILAIKHFVKFFSFSVSEQFMSQFKTMDPAVRKERDTYLLVNSTERFDATDVRGRGYIVSHVMAMVECADEVVSP